MLATFDDFFVGDHHQQWQFNFILELADKANSLYLWDYFPLLLFYWVVFLILPILSNLLLILQPQYVELVL